MKYAKNVYFYVLKCREKAYYSHKQKLTISPNFFTLISPFFVFSRLAALFFHAVNVHSHNHACVSSSYTWPRLCRFRFHLGLCVCGVFLNQYACLFVVNYEPNWAWNLSIKMTMTVNQVYIAVAYKFSCLLTYLLYSGWSKAEWYALPPRIFGIMFHLMASPEMLPECLEMVRFGKMCY